VYVWAESWIQKGKRYSATSGNQQEIFAEINSNNKTAQDGCVQTVRGKPKKQRVVGGDELCRSDFNFHDYLSLTIYKHVSTDVGHKIMSLIYVI